MTGSLKDRWKGAFVIHYEGQHDLGSKKFSGVWEMVTHTTEMGENDLEQLLRGRWEMQKDTRD